MSLDNFLDGGWIKKSISSNLPLEGQDDVNEKLIKSTSAEDLAANLEFFARFLEKYSSKKQTKMANQANEKIGISPNRKADALDDFDLIPTEPLGGKIAKL